MGDKYASRVIGSKQAVEPFGLGGLWTFRCVRPDGSIRWEDQWKNILVNQGKLRALNNLFTGSAQITSWYVGLLTDNTGWTAGVHTYTVTDIAGFDFQGYSNSTLPQWTPLSTPSMNGNIGEIQNTSPMAFNIDTNGSVIGGAFLCSSNVKATPGGELYAYGQWVGGANKNADSGDVLQVTATMTATSP